MALCSGSKKIESVYKGSVKIGQIYKGSQLIYQSAFNVTYVVDTINGVQTSYTEKIKPNTSMIPTTFTPTKSGYTFVGWRKDKTASSSVLTSAVATEHTTLYAVFSKAITVSYSGNGNTSGSTSSHSENMYYNNGNTVGAKFTLKTNGFAKTAYSFSKWALGDASGTQYAAGESVTLTTNKTFVAIWTANSSHDVFGSSSSPTLLISWGKQTTYDKDIVTIDLSGYSTIRLGAYYQVDSGGNNPTCDLYVDNTLVIEGEDSSTRDYVATSPKDWTITATYKKTCTIRVVANTTKCTKSAAVYAYIQLIK